jgi:hypothetical protein
MCKLVLSLLHFRNWCEEDGDWSLGLESQGGVKNVHGGRFCSVVEASFIRHG